MNYLKQERPEDAYILDIETDDINATVIWCVVTKNLASGEVKVFENAEVFNRFHQGCHRYIGHNILSFDIPTLNRLWDCSINLVVCIDTLVLSYLYDPAIDGGHSLAAWGHRLGILKGEFSDWSHYSEEMLRYCKQDVEVTYELYQQLTKKMLRLGYSEKSAEIEHKIRIIIDEQQAHGFWFDKARAERFCDELRKLQSDLSENIFKLFPPRRGKVAEYRFRRRKDGSPTASYETHRNKYSELVHYEVDGPDGIEEWYDCYEMIPFNLGSPKQRIERLQELGWEPDSFTKKGQPQVDEDALLRYATLSGKKEMVALAEWLVIQGRLTMIAGNPKTGSLGWLGNLGEDSRIHGKVLTCGATTRRMIHSNPNTANIPSGAKAKYGHECRSFWGVEPGKGLCLVGYDAAGLETAGLCHYLNNTSATDVLLRPKPEDVHTINSKRLTEALGRPIDREWGAKTSWYAWLYGAYPPKLGTIVKGPPSDGEIIIETFYRNVPGLKELINSIQVEYRDNNGLLRTIDGGFVRCPSPGAALNYKIQSAGAIVMKLTSILLKEEAQRLGILFKRVGDIHDEGQLETPVENADRLGRLAVDCISRAGRDLGFRVALTGDYKIGTNWSMTH